MDPIRNPYAPGAGQRPPELAGRDEQLAAFDREAVLKPLLDAALTVPPEGTLEAKGHADSQLTRRLRDALHAVLGQLQFGQVLLASIGSTAPFIGLFGTVWGIMSSFQAIAASKNTALAVVAPGIAEALHVSEAAVEKHVTGLFRALGLQPEAGEHRRVRAVLLYLRAVGRH